MLSRRTQALTTVCLPLLLSGAIMLAQKSRTRPDSSTSGTATATQSQSSGGERVFMANCSRCHTPPMSLSPRITGTVLMHMRVRARLSKQDEQLLLKYLAP